MERDVMDRPVERSSRGGKRLKPGIPVGAKIAIALVLVAGALFAAYAGLCAWVGDAIPDGIVVELVPSGQVVDLGGMSADEARAALAQSIQADEDYSLTVRCGGKTVSIGSEVLAPDSAAMLGTLARALDLAASRPFLARGAYYLAGRSGKVEQSRFELPCSFRFGEEGEAQVEQILEQLGQDVALSPEPPSYTVGEDSVEVTAGKPGASLDTAMAKEAVLTAMQNGETSLMLSLDTIEAPGLDVTAIQDEVYVEAVPMSLDSNGKPTPAVVGVSIDVDAAQAAVDAAAPGEVVTIPLVREQPDYTVPAVSELLYQDKLSECVTNIGGSAGRLGNVTLAAQKCNGYVLMPGDVFDYNKVVGQRTTAAGFSSAPAYVGGETVNEVGGGICQVSSSIYYCTVYANLQIVTRSNHRFAVGYVPDGLDATVSWGGPEYRFRNDTDYPIKITASVSGRTLTVRIYGTKTDGSYVTTERNTVSFDAREEVYKPDESIPQGTTKVDVSGHSGLKVVVYRVVHAADGSVISRTLENTSNYHRQDRIILYNPADAWSLGIDGAEPPAEDDPNGDDPTVSDPPVSEPPVSEPPVSEPPVSEPPVSEPPVSEPPVSEPPVSEPPSEPPVSEPPVSEPPVSDPSPSPSPSEPPLVDVTQPPEGGVPLD